MTGITFDMPPQFQMQGLWWHKAQPTILHCTLPPRLLDVRVGQQHKAQHHTTLICSQFFKTVHWQQHHPNLPDVMGGGCNKGGGQCNATQ